jgi:8-oxo-dGTP pyrophosphatase MutT (NUDIX family)
MNDDARACVRARLAHHQPLAVPDVVPRDHRIDTGVLVPLTFDPVPAVTVVIRAVKLREHAGEVGFPGGKPEAVDIDLADTALREAHEEIGLPPEAVEVLGSLSPIPVATSRYRIHPFVGWVAKRPAVWRLSGEVARAVDVPLEAIASGAIPYEAIEMSWAGHKIQAPFFRLDDDTRLYGASAFVLVELMAVVGPAWGFELPLPVLRRDGPYGRS